MFHEYIDNLYDSLELEIELKYDEMLENHKMDLAKALQLPKPEILELSKSYDHEFKAYQVAYHVTKPSEQFKDLFERLFIANELSRRLDKHKRDLRKILFGIRKRHNITVTISNDLDLTLPTKFEYTLKNIWRFDTKKIINEQQFSSELIMKHNYSNALQAKIDARALKLFKTKNYGWGISTLFKIAQGLLNLSKIVAFSK